jgi:DNA-nicking Smr family endonuclease
MLAPPPAMAPPRSQPSVDLHGLHPEQALRRVEQGLHGARVAGMGTLTIITGRGFGNRLQAPVLRGQVERFLEREKVRLGVLDFSLTSQGGALLVRLRGR